MSETMPQRRRAWMYAYRGRIESGLEECRECGGRDDLVLDRIQPRRAWTMENATILCSKHAADKYDDYQLDPRMRVTVQWRRHLRSLYREEMDSPISQRWGLLQLDQTRRAFER